jgi:spore germination protein GerM
MKSTLATASVILIACASIAACTADVKVPNRDDSASTFVDTPSHRDVVHDTTVVVHSDTFRIPGDSTPRRSANIRVDVPRSGDHVRGNAIRIAGTARVFENVVNYRLLDSERRELATGTTMATGDASKFSAFSATLAVPGSYAGRAVLEVFDYSARDGSRQDVVDIPLTIERDQSSTRSISIFLSVKGQDCAVVAAVNRTAPQTPAIARAALEALLRGPTSNEVGAGLSTQIPVGTTLRGVTITNGVASADFSSRLRDVAGSCRVRAIRAQIESTLKQFPGVRGVVILVEGDGRGVLQP